MSASQRARKLIDIVAAPTNMVLDELRSIVDKEQNSCSSDGSLSEESWCRLRDAVKHLEAFHRLTMPRVVRVETGDKLATAPNYRVR